MSYKVETIHVFRKLNLHLTELLASLHAEEWMADTNFPNWKVKDIVAHLLDTSVRRLSAQRDNYEAPQKITIQTYDDLIRHITELADRWANAFTVVSPSILVELVEKYQEDLMLFLERLDPDQKAVNPVAWAGQTESCNWFDIAREYTERWHHQMQVREALGRSGLLTKELYYPVLDTFMEALPHHYRCFTRENGYLLEVEVVGIAGGKWFLEWMDGERILLRKSGKSGDTRIVIDQNIAWKVFTRFNSSLFERKVTVEGDQEMGDHLLEMVCLMI